MSSDQQDPRHGYEGHGGYDPRAAGPGHPGDARGPAYGQGDGRYGARRYEQTPARNGRDGQDAQDAQYAAYARYAEDAEDRETTTQTWQGQTWDTATQPAVPWPGASAQPQGPYGPGQPQYPGAPGQPRPEQPYGRGQGRARQPYGQTQDQAGQPYGPEQGRAYPQQQPPYGSAAAPYGGYRPGAGGPPSAAEETALPAAPGPGAPAQPSGAYPLPPEVPAPAQQPPAATGQGPYAAPTEVLPPVPAHAGPGQAGPAHAGHPYPGTGAPAGAPRTPPPAGGGTDGYGAPTTLGNARVTDAQRARAEGRSPIIPPGIQPAGLTAALGLLLAGGAALGPYALLVPVVVLQAVTAAGWFRLNGMWPARQGIALAFLGGLVADAAVLALGRGDAPAAIIGTLGVWVLLTVVLQLRSHADPDTRLTGLLATVVSAALSIVATGHLGAAPHAVVVGAVAVAAATVVRALPLPGPASVVASLVVAAGAGLLMGAVTDLGGKGALLGLAAGVCALIGLRAASYDYPSRFVHMTAGVALPLTAAAPAVYLLGRVLG
ncbi:hypothetical protein [Streptomyces tremellae]|uniref:Integral membrane protein n=1 Tax=Streptomyces tremellae TaxID=1124239 RepID=A0ABP7F0M5_9ACTN